MMRQASFVLVLVGLLLCGSSARSSKADPFKPPWFCHGIDCPPYEVAKAYGDGDLELRAYSAGMWVSTNVSDVKYDTAVRVGFMRLFGYISGANERSEKIEMTAPVRVQLIAGQGPFCEDTFVVSFYLPYDYQDGGLKAPTPSMDNVYLSTTPAASYYVLSYGGFTSENKVLRQTEELLARLDELKEDYDASVFFSAGYDPPFRLINRHNEVWIPAAGVSTAAQKRIQPGRANQLGLSQ